MKRIISALVCLTAFAAESFATTYIFHNETVGGMSNSFPYDIDKASITTLVITGEFGDEDLKFVANRFNLDVLDTSGLIFGKCPTTLTTPTRSGFISTMMRWRG